MHFTAEGARRLLRQRRGEYQPEGEPVRVNVHDFVDPELGRAIPYGIYDETDKEGWVSVGDSADTAEFAVNAIRS